MSSGSKIPPLVSALGIVGALLCIIEKRSSEEAPPAGAADSSEIDASLNDSEMPAGALSPATANVVSHGTPMFAVSASGPQAFEPQQDDTAPLPSAAHVRATRGGSGGGGGGAAAGGGSAPVTGRHGGGLRSDSGSSVDAEVGNVQFEGAEALLLPPAADPSDGAVGAGGGGKRRRGGGGGGGDGGGALGALTLMCGCSSLTVSLRATLRILVPFALLSVCYCMWFVFMDFFDNSYRMNAWGYNSIDQTLVPVCIFPFLLIVDSIPALKAAYEDKMDQRETLWQAIRAALGELCHSPSSFATVFMYRGLINTRAVLYSYLAVWYDLNVIYLELTLIRICLSWMGALLLCLAVPRFIRATSEERRALLNPVNLGVKMVGTVAVTAALLVLNKK